MRHSRREREADEGSLPFLAETLPIAIPTPVGLGQVRPAIMPGPAWTSREARGVMHDWAIDEREYARHEARRGRRHAFERIEPMRAALVVVDMVPFFVNENPYARGIVPNIHRLARAMRSAGGVVAWVLPATDPPSPIRVEFYGAEIAERYRASGGDGPLRDRLWHGFEVEDRDLLVEKRSAGAFFPGHCELPVLLDAAGVDTVIVAGTVANVCSESTVRDAATLGYRTIMLADANAAITDRDLNATLHTIYRSFGDVRTTDEVITLITDARAAARPVALEARADDRVPEDR